MKKCIMISFLLLPMFYFAQNSKFRVGGLDGVNVVLLDKGSVKTKHGSSAAFHVSYTIKKKRSAFSFEPSLVYSQNNYVSKWDEFISIKYIQNNWGLNFQSGIQINEYVVFKSGFFIQIDAGNNVSQLFVQQQLGYKTISATNNDLRRGYVPTAVQAGLLFGFSFFLSEKQNFSFDIQLQQYGSRVADADYYLPTSKNQKMINKNAKPSVLLFGLSAKIQKRKKEQKEDPWREN